MNSIQALSSTPLLAGAPFYDGDVVLKSSDVHHFKVWRNILSIASPFFRQMLQLPQPHEQESIENIDGVPIIIVSEDKETLDILLRICYPLQIPNIEDIQIVDKVLDAAIKYEMERAVQEMCVLLARNFCDHSPVRVYVLACKHKLKEEAKLAAKACLQVPIAGVFMPELASISGLEYFRLLDYQNKASLAVNAIMTLDSSGPKFWYLFHTREATQFLSLPSYFLYSNVLRNAKSVAKNR